MVDGEKTITKTANAHVMSATLTQVVAPPRKLQPTPIEISSASTTGARLQVR